jgi:hypothetical protein
MGTGVESGRGVTLTPHPLLVQRSKKSTAIPLLSLRAFVAYKKGETYLYTYIIHDDFFKNKDIGVILYAKCTYYTGILMWLCVF